MALTINDTTYAGEAASSFIVKSVIGNEVVQKGLVYVKDGIKKAYTIPRLQVDGIIQDRIPTPISPTSSVGNLVVDGRTLNPADYMVYAEFDPRDFEAHWFATQLNPTLIDRRLPVSIESVLIQEVMKQHNKFLGQAILKSNKTAGVKPFAYFDGLITRAKADASVPKVASPVVLTVANIADALQSVLNATTPDVLYDPDMKFLLSYKTAQIYEQYQRTATFKNVDTTQAGIMRFGGRTIEPLFGMPDDTIFFAKAKADLDSNLWVGMNSIDDATVQLARLQANSEMYFIKLLMKVDTNYGFGAQTTLYAV